MRLTLITPVPDVEASDSDRALSGLALPYGVVGYTSAGPVTVLAGAVNIPADISRVILFREHGRATPVGHAVSATDTPAGLLMSFRAARTPDGDAALVEATEHVRASLSVELDRVEMENGNVTRADLTAVALTSIPAFAEARLVASASDPVALTAEPIPAAAPASTPPAPAATAPAAPVLVAAAASPAAATGLPLAAPGTGRGGALTAGRRGLSLHAAMQHVVTMVGGSQDANSINAALTDIIPAADTSAGAFLRPQWVDELWTPIDMRRPYSASVTSGVLTGMKVYGWKWGTRPVVAPYTGNKTAVPSGPVTFLPAEATATRHAGGWDVDRIFIDLGDASLLTAILQGAAMDYANKQEAAISAAIVAEATDKTATTVVGALGMVASTLAASGASPSFIALAADLWEDFTEMPASAAPWWLTAAGGSGVALNAGTATASDLRVFVDPHLTAGHVIGGDRRAVTHYEPAGNPFRVQAVNLPNGGVDIGVFGYDAVLVNDPRGVVDVTVA